MPHNRQKKIATIADFCGFGRCSITAALPILSALRVQCCPLPTAVFSNHTGFESFWRTDCTDCMEPYIAEWEKLGLRFDGILTGFLASERQIAIVRRFLERFSERDTVVTIDPVMGEGGALYPTYSPALAEQMASLLPYADILTPNLTEACVLCGVPYRADPDDAMLTDLVRDLCARGPRKVVITGIERGDRLENIVSDGGRISKVCEHRVGACRSGTGDVFSAILAADAVNGFSFSASVRHAASFVARVMRRTVALDLPRTDGICFEEYLCEIGEPTADESEERV